MNVQDRATCARTTDAATPSTKPTSYGTTSATSTAPAWPKRWAT
jgi:hypothetical protein